MKLTKIVVLLLNTIMFWFGMYLVALVDVRLVIGLGLMYVSTTIYDVIAEINKP